MNLSDREYSGQISYRDTKTVLTIMNRIAAKDGLLLSNFLRKAVRTYLETRKVLTAQERRTLGLEVQTQLK
jgi:hypothetical protein